MAAQSLNELLIQAMENKIPDGTRLANVLIDILFIGKEAVYRRLRGEVPFTLNEAAIIAQELGISLDNTIGTKNNKSALFNLSIVDIEDPIITYEKIVKRYCDLYKSLRNFENTELGLAANIIPHGLFLKYSNLAKLRLFKWLYQNDKSNTYNFVVSDKLRSLQKEYVREVQHIKSTIYILDNHIFDSFINDVHYFINIGLINKQEIEEIKTELLELLDEIEEFATKGKFKTGTNIQIYISNINFEATYTYLTSPMHNLASYRLYGINAIYTPDPFLYEFNRDFIQSLKKYSTLISESAEMQRIQYLNKQREIIQSLS